MRGRNLIITAIIVIGVLLLYNSSCSDMIARYRLQPADAGIETRGRDFYVSFQDNPEEHLAPGTPMLSLSITGDYDTTGSVSIAGLAFNQSFSVAAHQVIQMTLPFTALVASTDRAEDLGVHIAASQPVAVYGLNHRVYTSDSFLAYPVQTCGTEYFAVSYPTFFPTYLGSNFTIVGISDDTAVTITTTVASGAHARNATYGIVLDSGQTYRLYDQGGDGNDVTGSRILSDKPIAVFSGHKLTEVPHAVTAGDHLTEQLLPLSLWDTRYRLMPSLSRDRNTVRVLAGYDDTVVSFGGAVVATLDAGEFYAQTITAFTVVSADRPILAALFAHGGGDDGQTGDPFMICLPPTRQFRTEYTFRTLHEDFSLYYIDVIVPAGAVGGLILDGSPVDPGLFSAFDAEYAGARLPVTAGTHSVSGPARFGLLLYGFGEYDSYGSAGG